MTTFEESRARLTAIVGEHTLEQMTGLSESTVHLVETATDRFAWKLHVTANERRFYRDHAARLRGLGLDSPEVIAVHDGDPAPWLLLEWIPQELVAPEDHVDDEILASLALLHRTPTPDDEPLWRPQWTVEMNDVALHRLPDRDGLRDTFEMLREIALPSLVGTTPVSGDPNPRNWARRRDGALVLYDWERFTVATPELDVAIPPTTLPPWTMALRVAEDYLRHHDVATATSFARRLVALKAWTVVEFLSLPDLPKRGAMIWALAAIAPDWALAVAPDLESESAVSP